MKIEEQFSSEALKEIALRSKQRKRSHKQRKFRVATIPLNSKEYLDAYCPVVD